jgi:chromosome segregation ATPase
MENSEDIDLDKEFEDLEREKSVDVSRDDDGSNILGTNDVASTAESASEVEGSIGDVEDELNADDVGLLAEEKSDLEFSQQDDDEENIETDFNDLQGESFDGIDTHPEPGVDEDAQAAFEADEGLETEENHPEDLVEGMDDVEYNHNDENGPDGETEDHFNGQEGEMNSLIFEGGIETQTGKEHENEIDHNAEPHTSNEHEVETDHNGEPQTEIEHEVETDLNAEPETGEEHEVDIEHDDMVVDGNEQEWQDGGPDLIADSSDNIAEDHAPQANSDVDQQNLELEERLNSFEVEFARIQLENQNLRNEMELLKNQKQEKIVIQTQKDTQAEVELDLVKKSLLDCKRELQETKAALAEREMEVQSEIELRLQWKNEKWSMSSSIEKLVNEVAAKTGEIEYLKNEIEKKSNNSQVQSFQQQIAQLQAELLKKDGGGSETTKIQQLQKELAAKQAELSKKQAILTDSKKDHVNKLNLCQIELENQKQENISATLRNNLLQKRVAELEEKLNEKMDTLRDLGDNRLMLEQQFRSEMSAQKKLVNLYQEKCNQLSNHNEQMEDLIRELEEKVLSLNDGIAALNTEHESQAKRKDEEILEKQQTIDKLKKELAIINSDLVKNSISLQVFSVDQDWTFERNCRCS